MNESPRDPIEPQEEHYERVLDDYDPAEMLEWLKKAGVWKRFRDDHDDRAVEIAKMEAEQ